jgi:hypothetical protein
MRDFRKRAFVAGEAPERLDVEIVVRKVSVFVSCDDGVDARSPLVWVHVLAVPTFRLVDDPIPRKFHVTDERSMRESCFDSLVVSHEQRR